MSATKRFFLMLLLIFPVVSGVVSAQNTQPVVYGVFFYSPTCPHCHEVINNHWDGIQSEFGDQLQVLFVNVTVTEGSLLMQTTREALNIESSGVPMLVIGETVFVGSTDIPDLAPGFIREGLANGGINVSPVPGLEAIFMSALGDAYVINEVGELLPESTDFSDPINVMAVVVLVTMVLSILGVILAGIKPDMQSFLIDKVGYLMIGLSILASIGLTSAILAGSNSWLVSGLLVVTIVLLLISILRLMQKKSVGVIRSTVIPLLIFAGLIVAGYMSYVEITASDAVCGIAGNCNVVQQSDYAQLFGIPIGLIGIAGYVALLVVWFVGQQQAKAYMLMLVFAGIGVIFSIYLTYLEPFVIKATCAWCLTSSLLMMALLWAVASLALETQQSDEDTPVPMVS